MSAIALEEDNGEFQRMKFIIPSKNEIIKFIESNPIFFFEQKNLLDLLDAEWNTFYKQFVVQEKDKETWFDTEIQNEWMLKHNSTYAHLGMQIGCKLN